LKYIKFVNTLKLHLPEVSLIQIIILCPTI